MLGFHERVLVENLLENYHEELRPQVENNSQPTAVNISLRLIQIFEMVRELKFNIGTYIVQTILHKVRHI